MARASLSLPVKGNSVTLTPADVAAYAGEKIEPQEDPHDYEAWCFENFAEPVREARTRIDLRPRGAHAHAFA